MLMFDIILS